MPPPTSSQKLVISKQPKSSKHFLNRKLLPALITRPAGIKRLEIFSTVVRQCPADGEYFLP